MPATSRLRHIRRTFLYCLMLSLLLASCNLFPDVGSSSSSSTSTATGPVLNQWTQVKPGVEVRNEQWKSAGDNQDTVTIARFDLHRIHLSVGYQPSKPLTTNDWMKQTGALAIINGGYFDTSNQAQGLVISNSQVLSDNSYVGFGGMLSVDAQGNITLRSLTQQPYDPTEQLQEATQSSPMFVINGQRTQFKANAESQRRSVVAIDKQGRLLFIVSPSLSFTLDEMADLLMQSDLSIQTALNLDGGASTSLYVKTTSRQPVAIDPVTALPIVIIVK